MGATMNVYHRVGVCLFDKPAVYGSQIVTGWACIANEDPFRVECVGDLPTSAYWLTNIPENLCVLAGLSSNPRIFGEYYLRTRLSSILLELGLQQVPLDVQAGFLAMIFERVMSMADLIFGVDIPPRHSLAGGLAELHNLQYVKQDPSVDSAFLEACQTFTECERAPKKGMIWTTLMFHRSSHASDLLTTRVPNDAFYFLPSSDLPPPSQRLNWFLDLPMPAMAEVEIVCHDRLISRLINYGAGAGDVRRESTPGNTYRIGNQRSFSTKEEVRSLAEYSDVLINRVMVCPTPPVTPIPPLSDGRILKVSYSYGLLLENLWVSLTREKKTGRPKRTCISAWLQCEDRMRCFKKAVELQKEGIDIIRYGYGRITIAISEERWRDLPEIALRHKLLTPVLHGNSFSPKSSDLSTVEQALCVLFSNGHLDKLLEYDLKAYEWLINRKAA